MRSIAKTAVAAAALILPLAAPMAVAGTKTVNGIEVRDWQAVDIDKDGSISPEEMEKFLKETWGKKK
jgi:hypothetical protein